MSIIEVPLEGSLWLGDVSDRILLKHATLHAGLDPELRSRVAAAAGVTGRGRRLAFSVAVWAAARSGDVSTWDPELVLGELERRRDARGGGVL